MNPALPLLVALSVGGLLLRRRGFGMAWAVCGLAGIALLGPALALPDGIPSPAATLAWLPPWQGTGDPSEGNPLLRDVTFQVQPWLLFLRQELRAGRLPFWDPYQSSGSPYWSNGSGAPLFPLHLLFAALPLQLGWILLPWLRIVLAGCGAWMLARELGVSRPAALLSALTFPLSGMLVSFLLFPMGSSLALVPWVLWTVERIASGRGSVAALGIAGGLQLLAGHPETAAHTALLSAVWLLVRGALRPFAVWLRWTGGWMTAGALAAVQILPFALLLPETSRWRSLEAGADPPFSLLLQQPLRLVLPQMYGHPADGTWWGPFNYSATAVYAGALALPLAAAGLARCRGDRRWVAVAALLGFSFVAAYHWPGAREVLVALPILGRAVHHRLIFGVELGLALLMGAGCDRWLEGKRRGLLAGISVMGFLLAAAWAMHRDEWALRNLVNVQLRWTLGAAVVAALLAASLLWNQERRWAVWPLLATVALCDLLLAHGGINRALPIGNLYPETGAVSFLRRQPGRVAGLGEALRPNAALVYRLYDARGDDSVKLGRYERVYQTFAPGHPVYFQPIERWSEPWLDRLGVRWVLGGPEERAPDPRWRLAYEGEDARVWERPGALPVVRWKKGNGEAHVIRREPGRWEIDWRLPSRDLLIVAETWDRGWTARIDGSAQDVVRVDGALMGINLGPGEGTLDLRYRPPGFPAGAILSVIALLAIVISLARWPRPAPLMALTLTVFVLVSCGRDPLPQSFALATDVKSALPAGLSFPRTPEPVDLEVDHERRPAVLTTTGPWEWRGRVPAAATLHAGVQLLPQAWRVIRGFQAWVVAKSGEEREVLDVVRTTEWQNPRWLDLTVDLSRYSGREVTLQFFAALQGLPAEHRQSNVVAWGPVVLASRERGREEPPNVLFLLVDTLRRDHMTPYGYRRDTTPEIARWLAAPGTVLEDAYSQAPWTLPSVVSFLTGRSPGEMLGADVSAYGIPEKVPTLAERLAALGYETGGFIANPTLHAQAGFDRGFQTFHAPPADLDWMRRHADEVNARARSWLAAHQRQPFFLYVHYIDPHDPYDNPDVVGNRSPFESGYGGPVTGDWIHGIYNGQLQLPDTRRDRLHIEALYDSEIRYVDRFIGELLSSLEPAVLARTLVVLTADHGEELYDHGGWKHGQTLYDEQIRVPLIFRWDGHIPAGRRLAGTVRLLDLMPTLVSAAGGKADPAWQGIDLLPALTGARPLPRRPAFAQHLSGGPLRAAAVLGRQKLILFNPGEAFQPADGLQAFLWQQDLARLQRVELYDLDRDPGERENLAARRSAGVQGLEPAIHHRLDAQLPGLRLLAAGLPAGSRLVGSVTFERAPGRWVPYFLAPGDQARLAGAELRFELTAEEIDKGVRIEGDFGRILAVAASLDGRPVSPAWIRIGPGRPYGGGPLSPGALLSPAWPAPPAGGGLRLWLHQGSRPAGRMEANPETARRLRALGYLQ